MNDPRYLKVLSLEEKNVEDVSIVSSDNHGHLKS